MSQVKFFDSSWLDKGGSSHIHPFYEGQESQAEKAWLFLFNHPKR